MNISTNARAAKQCKTVGDLRDFLHNLSGHLPVEGDFGAKGVRAEMAKDERGNPRVVLSVEFDD